MSHHDHHHHHHDSDHDHDHPDSMPFEDKLVRILEHWIAHNDDHVRSFTEWADKARSQHREKAAGEIEKAARITAEASEAFRRALQSMGKG